MPKPEEIELLAQNLESKGLVFAKEPYHDNQADLQARLAQLNADLKDQEEYKRYIFELYIDPLKKYNSNNIDATFGTKLTTQMIELINSMDEIQRNNLLKVLATHGIENPGNNFENLKAGVVINKLPKNELLDFFPTLNISLEYGLGSEIKYKIISEQTEASLLALIEYAKQHLPQGKLDPLSTTTKLKNILPNYINKIHQKSFDLSQSKTEIEEMCYILTLSNNLSAQEKIEKIFNLYDPIVECNTGARGQILAEHAFLTSKNIMQHLRNFAKTALDKLIQYNSSGSEYAGGIHTQRSTILRARDRGLKFLQMGDFVDNNGSPRDDSEIDGALHANFTVNKFLESVTSSMLESFVAQIDIGFSLSALGLINFSVNKPSSADEIKAAHDVASRLKSIVGLIDIDIKNADEINNLFYVEGSNAKYISLCNDLVAMGTGEEAIFADGKIDPNLEDIWQILVTDDSVSIWYKEFGKKLHQVIQLPSSNELALDIKSLAHKEHLNSIDIYEKFCPQHDRGAHFVKINNNFIHYKSLKKLIGERIIAVASPGNYQILNDMHATEYVWQPLQVTENLYLSIFNISGTYEIFLEKKGPDGKYEYQAVNGLSNDEIKALNSTYMQILDKSSEGQKNNLSVYLAIKHKIPEFTKLYISDINNRKLYSVLGLYDVKKDAQYKAQYKSNSLKIDFDINRDDKIAFLSTLLHDKAFREGFDMHSRDSENNAPDEINYARIFKRYKGDTAFISTFLSTTPEYNLNETYLEFLMQDLSGERNFIAILTTLFADEELLTKFGSSKKQLLDVVVKNGLPYKNEEVIEFLYKQKYEFPENHELRNPFAYFLSKGNFKVLNKYYNQNDESKDQEMDKILFLKLYDGDFAFCADWLKRFGKYASRLSARIKKSLNNQSEPVTSEQEILILLLKELLGLSNQKNIDSIKDSVNIINILKLGTSELPKQSSNAGFSEILQKMENSRILFDYILANSLTIPNSAIVTPIVYQNINLDSFLKYFEIKSAIIMRADPILVFDIFKKCLDDELNSEVSNLLEQTDSAMLALHQKTMSTYLNFYKKYMEILEANSVEEPSAILQQKTAQDFLSYQFSAIKFMDGPLLMENVNQACIAFKTNISFAPLLLANAPAMTKYLQASKALADDSQLHPKLTITNLCKATISALMANKIDDIQLGMLLDNLKLLNDDQNYFDVLSTFILLTLQTQDFFLIAKVFKILGSGISDLVAEAISIAPGVDKSTYAFIYLDTLINTNFFNLTTEPSRVVVELKSFARKVPLTNDDHFKAIYETIFGIPSLLEIVLRFKHDIFSAKKYSLFGILHKQGLLDLLMHKLDKLQTPIVYVEALLSGDNSAEAVEFRDIIYQRYMNKEKVMSTDSETRESMYHVGLSTSVQAAKRYVNILLDALIEEPKTAFAGSIFNVINICKSHNVEFDDTYKRECYRKLFQIGAISNLLANIDIWQNIFDSTPLLTELYRLDLMNEYCNLFKFKGYSLARIYERLIQEYKDINVIPDKECSDSFAKSVFSMLMDEIKAGRRWNKEDTLLTFKLAAAVLPDASNEFSNDYLSTLLNFIRHPNRDISYAREIYDTLKHAFITLNLTNDEVLDFYRHTFYNEKLSSIIWNDGIDYFSGGEKVALFESLCARGMQDEILDVVVQQFSEANENPIAILNYFKKNQLSPATEATLINKFFNRCISDTDYLNQFLNNSKDVDFLFLSGLITKHAAEPQFSTNIMAYLADILQSNATGIQKAKFIQRIIPNSDLTLKEAEKKQFYIDLINNADPTILIEILSSKQDIFNENDHILNTLNDLDLLPETVKLVNNGYIAQVITRKSNSPSLVSMVEDCDDEIRNKFLKLFIETSLRETNELDGPTEASKIFSRIYGDLLIYQLIANPSFQFFNYFVVILKTSQDLQEIYLRQHFNFLFQRLVRKECADLNQFTSDIFNGKFPLLGFENDEGEQQKYTGLKLMLTSLDSNFENLYSDYCQKTPLEPKSIFSKLPTSALGYSILPTKANIDPRYKPYVEMLKKMNFSYGEEPDGSNKIGTILAGKPEMLLAVFQATAFAYLKHRKLDPKAKENVHQMFLSCIAQLYRDALDAELKPDSKEVEFLGKAFEFAAKIKIIDQIEAIESVNSTFKIPKISFSNKQDGPIKLEERINLLNHKIADYKKSNPVNSMVDREGHSRLDH